MENQKEFDRVANLPVDCQNFDMFYVDMGVALQNVVNGPLTEEQSKELMGEPLWSVIDRRRETTINKNKMTADLKRLANQEKAERTRLIAQAIEGLSNKEIEETNAIENAMKELGEPEYVQWGPAPNFKLFFQN